MPLLRLLPLFALLASQAHADTIDHDGAEEMVFDLMPYVEEAAGRPFVEAPSVGILTREQLTERLVAQAREAQGSSAAELVQGRVETLVGEVAQGALALYIGRYRGLFLVRESIESVFAETGASPELLEPVVRCVVAHELTHALQHQQANAYPVADLQAAQGQEALMEGQAVLVQEQLCEHDALQFMKAMQGTDVLASRPPGDRTLQLYGYGRHYVAVLQQRWTNDAVWWALSQPPPASEVLVAVGRSQLLQGWDDPALVGAPVRTMADIEGWEVIEGPVSPMQMLPQLGAGRIGPDAAPQALAGQGIIARQRGKQLALVVFALADPDEALEWIQARGAAVRDFTRGRGTLRLLAGDLTITDRPVVRPLRGLARREDLDGSLQLALPNRGSLDFQAAIYREHWAAEDGLLVGAFSQGVDCSAAALTDAMAQVLSRDLPTVPSGRLDADGEALLAIVAPPIPLPELRAPWQYDFGKAYSYYRREEYGVCQERVAAIVERVGNVDPVVALAHTCAAQAGDPAGAARWHAALSGPQAADPAGVMAHCSLLREAGRRREALALVEGFEPQQPEQRAVLQGMRVMLLGELGRIERAKALVQAGEGGAPARVFLASLLGLRDRYSEARALLAGQCSQMESPFREDCFEIQRELGN